MSPLGDGPAQMSRMEYQRLVEDMLRTPFTWLQDPFLYPVYRRCNRDAPTKCAGGRAKGHA